MTSAQKTIFIVAIVGAIGAAAYFYTGKAEQQTAENISSSSKDVVIEESTMKQLKSLGYTN